MMVLDSKNITVMMIDDDEINRQMAEMILTKKLPYRVITVESGMRGIELMYQYEVNLVLLDVTMPVWDGFIVKHILFFVNHLINLSVLTEKVL